MRLFDVLVVFVVVLHVTVLALDKDYSRTPEEIIADNLYSYESYSLTTEDGYILNLIRMPPTNHETTNTKLPILLVHALLSSAADWVMMGPKRGLAFLLHDAGYDVWLLNCRGNRYSMNHTTLDPNESVYWNYSWHEIGLYDIPKTIDHILEMTDNEKLIHVGHSQGSTSLFVLLSERLEYNKKIRAHIGLAPAAYVCHLREPITVFLASFERFGFLTDLLHRTGHFNLGDRLDFLEELGGMVCGMSWKLPCRLLFLMILSFDPIDMETASIVLGHYPSGSSSKQAVHYAQGINRCGFHKYQESKLDKLEKYNIENIRVPIYAFAGASDTIQSPIDTIQFGKDLRNGYEEFHKVAHYKHLDFTIKKDAPTKIYSKILEIINRLK